MIHAVKNICMVIGLSVCATLFFLQGGATAAVVGFDAGHIIDDIIFTDSSSMSVQEIQNFLNSKVPACDTWGEKMYNSYQTRAQFAATIGQYPPFTCIKDYVENGVSAAQIIFNAAQTYTISPKVLIVLLQKEQGLITDEWPYSSQYRTATGYGCPDTAACDAKYFGFTNQINRASDMFHQIMIASPYWYTPYVVGNNYIQYNPSTSCGGSNVFIVNRATQALYNYTPYQPNQATLDAGWGTAPCGAYGNRNFYLYFTSWFGGVYSGESGVFKGEASDTVYVRSGSYKLAIPSMAILQDFGYDPNKIATISQTRVDAIPTPPTSDGLSSGIGQLLKTPSDIDLDGGAVYFVTRGKKSVIKSMDQFNAFNFNVDDIRYVDMDFINSIPSDNPLSDYIQMPDYTIMQVTNGIRRMIFDIAAYNALNPGGYYTKTSEAAVASLPGGNPISSNTVIIKKDSDDPIYLYNNEKYYFIPSKDVFDCWGVNQNKSRHLVTVTQNRLPKTIVSENNLACSATLGMTNYIFSGNEIYSSDEATNVPVSLTLPSSIADIINSFDNRGILKPFVKTPESSAIWNISSGKRKAIPSAANYQLLGSPAYDTIPSSVVNNLSYNGIALANGALIKTDNQSAVYVVSNGNRYIIPSAEVFTSIGYDWNRVETYADQQLESYPIQSPVVSTHYTDSEQNLYVLSQKTCYSVPKEFTPAYNIPSTTAPYGKDILYPINFSNCRPATKIVKDAAGSSTVFILENGRKLPFATWATLVNYSNSYTPVITPLPSELINQYPFGPTLY